MESEVLTVSLRIGEILKPNGEEIECEWICSETPGQNYLHGHIDRRASRRKPMGYDLGKNLDVTVYIFYVFYAKFQDAKIFVARQNKWVS